VNNRYNDDLEVNGSLTINSNLIVLGDTTQLDTIVYTTERLEVVNANNTTTAFMVKQNTNNSDIFVASNMTTAVLRIANNGDVLISGNGVYKRNNRDVILDTSNYVLTTNNNLTNKMNTNDENASNYILSTSNILSNRLYILDQLTSNVVNNSIATLNNKVNANDNNVSNYVLSTSNRLALSIKTGDDYTSNYVSSVRNFLIDYNNLTNKPDGTVAANNTNVSNYVLSTSNLLAQRLNKYSLWEPVSSSIYYISGNVGIGTNDPQNKLHIYDETNNETKLIIQNNTSIVAGVSPTEIVVVDAVSTTIGVSDRMIRFPYLGTGATKDYSFTTTQNLLCDILVVGGGGGGGRFGGGGGGGAILFATNIKISNNSSVSIKVGNGGAGSTIANTGVNGVNGVDSSITLSSIEYIVKGGGGGGSRSSGTGDNGSDGGSGGGGSGANGLPQGLGGASNKYNYANFQSFGNSGGKGRPNSTGSQPEFASGGGGGAGSVGSDFTNATGGGNGGTGKDFITYFGSSVGHSGWFGGGGGGQTYSGVGNAGNQGYGNGGNGLLGGGGNGGYDGTTAIPAVAGLANTGGGGGGSKEAGTGSNAGGAGGTGVVIIRYRLEPSTSTSLELVRGTTTDASVDYSVGNYDSVFKIKSVNAGTPTDRLVISSAGNVDITGSVNATSYLLGGSNILTKVDETSNYVLTTSNNLILKSLLDNTNTSNYVLTTSNLISTRITNLTTDMITQNTSSIKKFIVNNRYNNNLELNGTLTINSNLIVLGDSTRLDTIVYTTERLEVVNANNTTTALMVQQNSADRDIFVASNINTAVFRIANNGDVLINGIGSAGVYKRNNRDVILDTSNYILSTCNYLINYNNLINKPDISAAQVNSDWNSVSGTSQILNKPDLTVIATNNTNLSNYVLSTSNRLILKTNFDITNVSNYVLTASNNLILKSVLDNTNTSNYVLTASNNLILKTNFDNTNVSNYVLATSNLLINYNNLINKPDITAIATNNTNLSNYILSTSNNLILNANLLDSNTTAKITLLCNTILAIDAVNDINVSNYVLSASNYLVNYNNLINKPDLTAIATNNTNASNYVLSTSNNLILKTNFDNTNVSNYVLATSNNLILKTNFDITNVSNYVFATSNRLILKTNFDITNVSNYVLATSNNLILKSVLDNTNVSNYVLSTSNNLILKANLDNTNASNYVLSTSNNLILKSVLDNTNVSNYVLSTSNLLAQRLNKYSLWEPVSSSIYYISGNVGIGTTNPSTDLHLYDEAISETKLTIQNNYTVAPASLPNEITVVGASGATIGSLDRYIMFPYTSDNTGAGQTQYTFSPTENLICDILVVGGGGGGGAGHGGGGGAGQLILIRQATLNIGNYTIKVGKGGIGAVSANEASVSQATKGSNSSFNNIVVAEGGGANTNNANDKNGGSGAGGDGYTPDGGTSGFGIKDNNGDTFSSGNVYSRGNDGGGSAGAIGGGGGGSGGAGNGSVAGNGLSGISQINYDFKTYFGTGAGKIESDGLVWFAGGGGGGNSTSIGGLGGGGSGAITTTSTGVNGGNATNGTGSGGGGGSGYNGDGGLGGSGIVIIRYRKAAATTASASIELIRGTSSDTNTDYKLGNYNGDFKIMSSVSSVDTNRLLLTSGGDITVSGSVNATSYLLGGSNILTKVDETSNYILSTSNNLIRRIDANNTNASNYIQTTSNNLILKANLDNNNTSNYILTTSNLISTRITNLTTDMIAQDTTSIKKYIINNSFNNSLEVNGSLTVNSNLIVLGDSTRLDTIVYTTERLEVVNANNTTTAFLVQQNSADRDIFVASNINTAVFRIANNGDVLINGLGVYKKNNRDVVLDTSNYIATVNTTLTTADTALGVRVENTSNYIATVNTALTTSIGTKQDTLTSTSLAPLLNTTTDFVVNGAKIELTQNTSNYIATVNTALTTSIGTKQNTINSTANQLIIGNGNGLTTTNAGLTFATDTLTATNIAGAGANITALNMGNALTGTLAVARGGTGSTALTAGQVLIGNTTAILQTANLTWNTANGRLGIGTATPAVSLHVVGEIVATNNITSYYSDERLKTKIGDISEPLKIINNLNGFYYIPNELAHINGITSIDREIGLSAQEVQRVLPEIVKIAPFDLETDGDGKKKSRSGENYLTMSYERLAPVFVEAIKELYQKNIVLEQKNIVLEQKYNKVLEDIIIIKKRLELH
jgi:galactitol-specific phosphotransferase system IIB component